MDQETINEKSLELIHKTKKFLLLERAYERSLAALHLISRAKLDAGRKLHSLPKRILPQLKSARNLDEAERLIERRISELKIQMGELSSQIRELSDLLEPYSSHAAPLESKEN